MPLHRTILYQSDLLTFRHVGCCPADKRPGEVEHAFREEVGVPVHQYQQRTRIARAVDLLLETDRDLTVIALDLGFASHSHFTSVFRRMTGAPPSEFRTKSRKILIAPAAANL